MIELNPSLYEVLLQNFNGELDLEHVSEHDQPVLSVLDNLQRILSARAGALSHLPDYGLPDLGASQSGVPAATPTLIEAMTTALLKYEPRLAAVAIESLSPVVPGHLEFALKVQLIGGKRVECVTTLVPGGSVRVVRQHEASAPLTNSTRATV
ncbi:type VI secretion system baseplate subunit TssE [Pseudomonas sp. SMN5]|uniref:type VI secretion system baseplate subunit TssE n=1 Tax=Pseudomonas sp. SMN5 TaxID=3390198 RepID=UPI003F8452BA